MNLEGHYLAGKMLHRSLVAIGDEAMKDYADGVDSPENREVFTVLGTWLDGLDDLSEDASA